MITVYGAPLSQFVRKVLVVLDYKGLSYENQLIVPGQLPEGFEDISPLRKIPVYQDERITIPDSSVICQYLEDKCPEPPVYPRDMADKARALWFEEYADSKLAELMGRPLFFEKIVKPAMTREPFDEAIVRRVIQERLPPVLDYLESQAPTGDYWIGDHFTIADISIATQFLNAQYAEYEVDAERWPKLAAYLDRILAAEQFSRRIAAEASMLHGLTGD